MTFCAEEFGPCKLTAKDLVDSEELEFEAVYTVRSLDFLSFLGWLRTAVAASPTIATFFRK